MKSWNKDTIRLSYAEDNGGWWMAKGQGNAKPKNDYPKLKVDFDKSGEFTFVIQNANGTKFAKDAFVPKGNNPSDFGSQFTVTGQGTETLKVMVKNEDPTNPTKKYDGGNYTYALQFTDKPPLDPIITNGGCCRANQTSIVYYSLGAVALVALVVLVIRPMLARSGGAMKDRDLS